MLQRLRPLMDAAPDSACGLAQARADALRAAFGEPIRIDADTDRIHRVDVHVFGRDFAPYCGAADSNGCVLATSGMSDRLMTMPAGYDGGESAACELLWYVRQPHPELIARLRWLAKLPFAENSWLGHGHTVPMPAPPLSFSAFATFLLLPPAIAADRRLFDGLDHAGHGIEPLAVHLLSDAESDLVRSDEGLDLFLDLQDVHRGSLLFDPQRASYV